MAMTSINPATGEEIKTFEPLTEEQIDEKLELSARAFRRYGKVPYSDRAKTMVRLAEILEEEKEEYACLMTTEMGKTFVAAVAEAEKCAWVCRYYAENAEQLISDEVVETGAARSFVRYQPFGPILAVMPWNFPFWQVFRHVAPGLMAGNVILLKHASNVPQCALAIEEVVHKAGFPEGTFQTLLIGSDKVQAVIEDSRVRAVTLTGSEGAGRQQGGGEHKKDRAGARRE